MYWYILTFPTNVISVYAANTALRVGEFGLEKKKKKREKRSQWSRQGIYTVIGRWQEMKCLQSFSIYACRPTYFLNESFHRCPLHLHNTAVGFNL